MATTLQTLDGYAVSTIEQEGEYVDQDMGRVWIRHPYRRTTRWAWYGGFASPDERDEAVRMAQTMTAAEFGAWWDAQA